MLEWIGDLVRMGTHVMQPSHYRCRKCGGVHHIAEECIEKLQSDLAEAKAQFQSDLAEAKAHLAKWRPHMTTDTDTLVARLRDKFCCDNGCNCDEAADRIEALEEERDAASDIVQGIEILTATGCGLTPEETAALHWMAQAGRSDTPITEPTLFSDLVKAQEAIVRLIAERDAWKANAEALAIRLRHHEEYAWAARWTDKPFQPSETLVTHEALMKGGA